MDQQVPVPVWSYVLKMVWLESWSCSSCFLKTGWHPTWQDSIEDNSLPHSTSLQRSACEFLVTPWVFPHMGVEEPQPQDNLSSVKWVRLWQIWRWLYRIWPQLCVSSALAYIHTGDFFCVFVYIYIYIYIWQHSTWPHLLLVFWQVVIIFIFCCCSLQPSLYTVDQYVIPLLLLWFGTDNVWEDKPVQAERNACVLRHFHMIYVGFISSLFLPSTYCIASDMQHGCKRGGRIKWGCETDKLLMLWADAT